MKFFHSFAFCWILSLPLSAQEGFWSIAQLPQIQSDLQAAGIPIPIHKIHSNTQASLAQALLRLDYGNASIVNSKGLALGMASPAMIPDSIWNLMRDGVWIADPGKGIRLPGRPVQLYQSTRLVQLDASNSNLLSYEGDERIEIHPLDGSQSQFYEQRYKMLGQVELIGVFRVPPQEDPEYYVGLLLRILPSVSTKNTASFIPPCLQVQDSSPHLVLGYPQTSSIHQSSFELQYDLDLSRCHYQLDRALGEYLTRSPFITEDGVFRHYEDALALESALGKRALLDAEFRHQLSLNPTLKARYGPLLDSCRQTFQALRRFVPALVYTKGIVYSPCSFFESVRLFTMWRGRIGTSAHRLPTAEEGQYFPDIFTRVPPTENELLLPELLSLYFEQLPEEHLSPYAIRQAVYANKDYQSMSETLLLKSKFSQPEAISRILKEDFLQNIDLIAKDPAVHLVDSILSYYAEKVVPSLEKIRYIAFQKAKALRKAYTEVLNNYPAYPDADHSLRISYGIQLMAKKGNAAYWISNAHLLSEHLGSPVINTNGQMIGMVKGLEASGSNPAAYFYDSEKSATLIWRLEDIRRRIAMHPQGSFILQEWQ